MPASSTVARRTSRVNAERSASGSAARATLSNNLARSAPCATARAIAAIVSSGPRPSERARTRAAIDASGSAPASATACSHAILARCQGETSAAAAFAISPASAARCSAGHASTKTRQQSTWWGCERRTARAIAVAASRSPVRARNFAKACPASGSASRSHTARRGSNGYGHPRNGRRRAARLRSAPALPLREVHRTRAAARRGPHRADRVQSGRSLARYPTGPRSGRVERARTGDNQITRTRRRCPPGAIGSRTQCRPSA